MVITSRRRKELWEQSIPTLRKDANFGSRMTGEKYQRKMALVEGNLTKKARHSEKKMDLLSKERLNIMSKTSATYFLKVTKAWDHASKKQRESILKDFVRYNKFTSSTDSLERELLNGASLFFTRISSWFRLSYMLEESNLTLILNSISIFLSSANEETPKFVNEFVEIGGILTVIEVLNLSFASDESKIAGLRVINLFAKVGVAYQEILCECRVVDFLVECLSTARSEVLLDGLRETLMIVGMNNTKFIGSVYKSMLTTLNSSTSSIAAQQVSGQVIRKLLPQIGNIHGSVVDALVNLLKSPYETTQIEAYEILKEISKRPPLQLTLIRLFATIVKAIIDDSNREPNQQLNDDDFHGRDDGISSKDRNADHSNHNHQHSSQGSSNGTNSNATGTSSNHNNSGPIQNNSTNTTTSTTTTNNNTNKNTNNTTNHHASRNIQELFYAAKMQQAYVAKLLGVMAAREPHLAKEMIDSQAISGLFNLLGHLNHRPSQKAATETLLFFIDTFDFVAIQIQTQLGNDFYEMIQKRPDTFFKELTPLQLHKLKQNNIVIESDPEEFQSKHRKQRKSLMRRERGDKSGEDNEEYNDDGGGVDDNDQGEEDGNGTTSSVSEEGSSVKSGASSNFTRSRESSCYSATSLGDKSFIGSESRRSSSEQQQQQQQQSEDGHENVIDAGGVKIIVDSLKDPSKLSKRRKSKRKKKRNSFQSDEVNHYEDNDESKLEQQEEQEEEQLDNEQDGEDDEDSEYEDEALAAIMKLQKEKQLANVKASALSANLDTKYLASGDIQMPDTDDEEAEIDLSNIRQKRLNAAHRKEDVYGIYVPLSKANTNKLLPHYKFANDQNNSSNGRTDKQRQYHNNNTSNNNHFMESNYEQDIHIEMLQTREQVLNSKHPKHLDSTGEGIGNGVQQELNYQLKELQTSIKKLTFSSSTSSKD